eukprot:6142600-Amphidinium_carterae.1
MTNKRLATTSKRHERDTTTRAGGHRAEASTRQEARASHRQGKNLGMKERTKASTKQGAASQHAMAP